MPPYTTFAIQALYLRYSTHDVIVFVRSQVLYLRYSTCNLTLSTIQIMNLIAAGPAGKWRVVDIIKPGAVGTVPV